MKEALTVTIGDPKEKSIKMDLNVRQTLDGHILVRDHHEIDIVINISDKKISTFPKGRMDDGVYAAQDRLFDFLSKNGIIKRESIQSGNVYASMEAEYPETDLEEIDPVQVVLFSIGKWVKSEKPVAEMEEFYEKQWLNYLLAPDEENSTELGEVPHAEEKGSNKVQRVTSYLGGYGAY